jgi:hypothetical protein
MRVVRLKSTSRLLAGYPGALRLTFRYPAKDLGRAPEPFIATGMPGEGDLIFFLYVDPDRDPDLLVVGYHHFGGSNRLSEPLRLDRKALHTAVVSMGSLFPAAEDPVFRGHPEALPPKRLLYLKIDARVVFNIQEDFHPTPPNMISVGMNLIGAPNENPQFTARILTMERVSTAELLREASERETSIAESYPQIPNAPHFSGFPGPVEFTLRLRDSDAMNLPEPLITTGLPGAGDVLFLAPVETGRARGSIVIGLDHWGGGAVRTPPIDIDRRSAHTFVVSMGSLFPPAGDEFFHEHPEWLGFKRLLFVRVDGRVVFDAVADFHDAPLRTLTVGGNFIGASSAVPRLSAELLSMDRISPASLLADALPAGMTGDQFFPVLPMPLSLGGYPGAIKIVLRFPEVAGDYYPGPLVTTGRSGAGDVLFFRYVHPGSDPSLIQIGHDHWGGSAILSKPQRIDRTASHSFAVSMGSLFPPTGDAVFLAHPEWLPLKQRLIVSLDGVIVLDCATEFHATPQGMITLGQNSIGASTASGRLSAQILEVDNIPAATILEESKTPSK